MTCRDVNAFLADYLDGELAPAVHARFEAHLGRCVRCLEYLVGYRATRRLVRAIGGPRNAVHGAALRRSWCRRSSRVTVPSHEIAR
jgi:anti-sigma factor RsiW